jgi:CubicO group peptidase (beta-lactamase class C family)
MRPTRIIAAMTVVVLHTSVIAPGSASALAAGLARTQFPGESTPAPPSPGDTGSGTPTALELEVYVDGLMAAYLRANQVAGATVAIVRDGARLFAKGYGYADVDGNVPVDPARTLFRIGSVSKLFTWTAVMQLRDAGLVDLDADVGQYLDFPIPDTYPEPITLRHLLTHTAGFEDRAYGLFGPLSGLPRGESMRRALPARVRPPGTFASYSNYGSALAGYIVERVSGLPWETYIEQRILEPLGMDYASTRQPLPDALADHVSIGYRYEDGRFAPQPFEWIEMAPAGSISVSAEAMAAFMIAHLQGGAFGDARILADSTTREMHTQSFAGDPRVSGMALGFAERSSHGLRLVGHSGGTRFFFTDLVLVPSEGLGIFISTNSEGGRFLLHGAIEAILDLTNPGARPVTPRPAPGWEDRVRAYAGPYRFLRRSYSTFERFLGLMSEVAVEAAADAPGEVLIRTPEFTARFHEVEPGHLRTSDGSIQAAFTGDAPGSYTHLFLSTSPATAAERVPIWQTRGLHLALMAIAVPLMLSLPVLAVFRRFSARMSRERRPRGGQLAAPAFAGSRTDFWSRLERLAPAAAIGVVLLNAGFLAIFGLALDQDSFLTAASTRSLRIALLLPVLSLPLAAVALAAVVPAIRRRWWTPSARVHFVLVTAAATVFLAQLAWWNLLGWWF